jgi:hypothetical protein
LFRFLLSCSSSFICFVLSCTQEPKSILLHLIRCQVYSSLVIPTFVLSSIWSPGYFFLCCSNCIKWSILCSTPTGSCRISNFTRFLLGRTCCLRSSLLCTLPCVSYRLGSSIRCASNLFLRGICSLVRRLLRGLLRTLSNICYCCCRRYWSVGSSTSLCPATALVVPPNSPTLPVPGSNTM